MSLHLQDTLQRQAATTHGDAEPNDGDAARHGLANDVGEALTVRREAQEIQRAVHIGHVVISARASPDEALSQTELGAQPLELSAVRLRAIAHVYVDDASDYYEIADGLPRYPASQYRP